jgi:hypothetical protein
MNQPSRKIRREVLREGFQFECLCPACVNDYQFDSLPSHPQKFKPLPKSLPNQFKDAVTDFKEQCEYTKKYFKNYPSQELAVVQERMTNLLIYMREIELFPL